MIYLLGFRLEDGSLGNLIKIGFCEEWNLTRRIKELQTGNPYEVVLLGHIPGDILCEQELHRRWNEYRYRGEWFKRRVPYGPSKAKGRNRPRYQPVRLLDEIIMEEEERSGVRARRSVVNSISARTFARELG